MVARVLYSDREIRNMEVIHRWYEIVEHIDKVYEDHKGMPFGEEVLCLAIFETWYIINILPDTIIRYHVFDDYDFYLKMWKHYVAEGIDNYYDSAKICWMIGYTCTEKNKRFEHLKNLGKDMLRRGLKLQNPIVEAFDVLSGKKRKPNDYYMVMPEMLFPSESAADKYFRDMLYLNIEKGREGR